MREVQHVYQVAFVMFDGAILHWRLFSKLEHYQAFVDSVTEENMRKLGIEAIRYTIRTVE